MNLNGDLTAGENTADNGGLYESLYAFTNWMNKSDNGCIGGSKRGGG